MKKTLVIHGGMHKTGSTAIQHMLYANRTGLLGKGILYPLTGLVYDSQSGNRHLGLLKALENSATSSDIFIQFNQEVAESGCNVIILSHEDIFSPVRSILEGAKLLTENYDVKLICYFRDPIQYFNAKYKEWVRRQDYIGEPADFVIEHLDYLAWDKLLIPWFELLPENNIVVRKYAQESLVNQSSIDDFCDALSSHWEINIRELLSELPGSNNKGLTNRETMLVLMKNKYFLNQSDSEMCQSKFLDLLESIKMEEKQGLVISRDVARPIKARNWHARHYMQKKMSIEFDLPPIDELIFDKNFNDEELRVEYKRAISNIFSASFSLSNS